MMEVRQEKAKSTSKLTYMDKPEPRRPTQPSAAESKPLAAEPQPSAAEPKQSFVIPTPADVPPSDDEVLIDFLSHLLILTVARARLACR